METDPPAPLASATLASSALWLSLLALAITLLSFGNQLIMAHAFGASARLDRYFQATSVPMLVMGAFVGLFSFSVVPVLGARRGDARFSTASGAMLVWFSVLGVVTALIGVACTPFILARFGISAASGEYADARAIALVSWSTVALAAVSGYLGALLTTVERFALPTAATALPYLGMITGIVVAGVAYGPIMLAWGMLAGTIVGLVIFAFSVRKLIALPRTLRDFDGLRIGVTPLVIASVLSFSAYQTIDSYWGPRVGEGTVSYLSYSQRLLIAIGNVVAVGPMALVQPRLVTSLQESVEAFLNDAGRGLRLTLVVAVGVATVTALLAMPIVQVAFQRGAFSGDASRAIAELLPWMMGGMVPMVCVVFLFKALYVRHDQQGPLMLGMIGPSMYIVSSGILSSFFGARGIAAGYLVTWLTLLVVGAHRLWANHVRSLWSRTNGNFLLRVALAAAVTLAVGFVVRRAVIAPLEVLGLPSLALRTASVAVIGGMTYLVAVVAVFPVDEARTLMEMLRRRLRPAR